MDIGLIWTVHLQRIERWTVPDINPIRPVNSFLPNSCSSRDRGSGTRGPVCRVPFDIRANELIKRFRAVLSFRFPSLAFSSSLLGLASNAEELPPGANPTSMEETTEIVSDGGDEAAPAAVTMVRALFNLGPRPSLGFGSLLTPFFCINAT